MKKAKWTLGVRILLMGTGLGALTVLQGALALNTMYRTRRAILADGSLALNALGGIQKGIPEVWAILIFTVVVGTTIALLFARIVSRSLAPLEKTIRQLGRGVLKGKIQVESGDDLGYLASYLNGALDQMTCTVSGIDFCSDKIASASDEIMGRTNRAAEVAVDQRDRLRLIGASMREMASNAQEISTGSISASRLAMDAAESASQGGGVVRDALNTMTEIATSVHTAADNVNELRRSSAQVGRIVSVIDDIAGQTNLLALNAAIEAARAGHQGRGFAVVAGEVRQLAERTAAATKEVAETITLVDREIQRTVAQMQEGTHLVACGVQAAEKAGSSLEKIIATANDVGAMIQRISVAAEQQGNSANEINEHLEQMSRHTAERADDVQNSKDTCKKLTDLSASLKKIISQFQFQQIIHEPGGEIGAR